ncbi:MAG: hypothetical protein AAFR04_08300 [Pseudomonadota bacterium]
MVDGPQNFLYVDNLFVWAMLSFGWGLSLATYSWFAERQGWSRGEVQANQTAIAVLIGLGAMMLATLFTLARVFASAEGDWGAIVVGLAFGLLWTAIFRVYSQVSLFLAPMAAVILLFSWVTTPASV